MDVKMLSRLTWLGAAAAGVVCGDTHAGVIINEIMNNPASVSDARGEWFELYNAGPDDVDLFDWTIFDRGTNRHIIDSHAVVSAGGFMVLARHGDSAMNGGIEADYVYGADLTLGNGADELILIDGAGVEVDRVEWDGGPLFPDPEGVSMGLVAPWLDNNLGPSWRFAGTESVLAAGDFGTPGSVNFAPVPSASVSEPSMPLLLAAGFLSLLAGLGRSAAVSDSRFVVS